MIVKNEAHVIRESLTCVLPLIETYCIVDTGSTDDTIQVIRNFFDETNIQGEVHERPWKDFGTNRSEALALCDGKMDYILVIDADDLMTFPSNGRELLNQIVSTNPSNVMVDIRMGNLCWRRSQIFKANDGWKYVGVLHEYATNGKVCQTVYLPEFQMEGRHLGGRHKEGNHVLRDIATLEQGLLDEPTNGRYMFYLAQSYRDNKNTPKAIEWYTRRFEHGGWYEETYVAGMNIVRLTNSKEWAWKAHQSNPKRIECLVSYMAHCRATNKWSRELYAMALYATTIPKPTDQILFLENDIYDWKVWDEFSIIAYYTEHYDESYRACLKLLENPRVPVAQLERIRANSLFSCTKIAKSHSS
jgi:glycosyltransferase involved in cell wall biosynthesis